MGDKYPRHKQLVWYMRFDGTIWSLLPCGNQPVGSNSDTTSERFDLCWPRRFINNLRRHEHGELERRHVGHAGRRREVHVALFLRGRRVREYMSPEFVSRGHVF